MSIEKKSNKEIKKELTPEEILLNKKRKRKKNRLDVVSEKREKRKQNLVVETNTFTTVRAKSPKEKFSDLELELITFVKQLVTKYKNNEFTKITFRIKDFLDTIGSITKNYKHVREAGLRIQDTQIIMTDDEKNYRAYSSYFSTVIVDEDPSEITVTIDPEVLKHLGRQNKYFVSYRADIIYKIKGSYSKMIYPYFKAILNKSQRPEKDHRITVDELKELLGIEGIYERFSDLNMRIIKKFIKEINGKTDISLECIPEKKGRKTHKLLFVIKKQKQKPETIGEAMDNPATEQLKKQGFNDDQVSKMLDVKQDFIPGNEHMAILSNFIYIGHSEAIDINNNLVEANKKETITVEAFKEICQKANRYYKFLDQKNKKAGKHDDIFLATNIFKRAIKERWDKNFTKDKEMNPQDPLKLTTEQKVKEIANNEELYDELEDFLLDNGSDKARSLNKSMRKQGILKTFEENPSWFNLVDKFWTVRG